MTRRSDLHRTVLAYCRKGAACGNPFMGGAFYYTEGSYVACPRCGGPCMHSPKCGVPL